MALISNIGLGPLKRLARQVRLYLPQFNWLAIHWAYFIGTCLFSAILLWVSATPFRSLEFTDALFLATSAMTEAGLNTVNLSTLNTFQQILLFVLIILGSAIFVSASIIFARVRAFEKEFTSMIQKQRVQKQKRRMTSNSRHESRFGSPASRSQHINLELEHIEKMDGASENDEATAGSSATVSPQRGRRRSRPSDGGSQKPSGHYFTSYPNIVTTMHTNQASPHFIMPFNGVVPSARSDLESTLGVNKTHAQDSAILDDSCQTSLSPPRPVGRNSQFSGLSSFERQRLGGYEYRAVLFLSFLVPIYFVLWQLLGAISCGAWIAYHRASTTLENGMNPWWVGAFNAVSAFNNSGMSLLDANMTAFQDSYFLLLSMGLFILAGNTCYPIFLRLAVWTIYKALPDNDFWRDDKATLRFLLDHPRRCYTNMFPSHATWWLLFVVVVLNITDWVAFEVLNIGNKAITILSPGIEVVDGLFQAIAVRSGGFYVVTITDTRISLQVLYVLMMFISAYPVVITMRNSNVYEERSLGIFAEDRQIAKEQNDNGSSYLSKDSSGPFGALSRAFGGMAMPPAKRIERRYFVQQQLRAQLAHDSWWIALAVFVIMIIEGAQFESNPTVFSVFNVIFETVSGYGCVGISTGVPWAAYSFSGSWHALSKLVLVAVMLRGRHRGLPVEIDHAVQLPGADLAEAEEEDGRMRVDSRANRQYESV